MFYCLSGAFLRVRCVLLLLSVFVLSGILSAAENICQKIKIPAVKDVTHKHILIEYKNGEDAKNLFFASPPLL